MKVQSINNQNINHQGLRINYNAEYKLRNSDISVISALFKVGREHETNQYIDILVLKNMSYRIAEKANPFFRIREPFSLKKVSDNKLNIAAVYDGAENVYKQGDRFNIGVDMKNSADIDDIINKFGVMKGLQRISFIAKLLEENFVKTKGEQNYARQDKNACVARLLDRYADVVV